MSIVRALQTGVVLLGLVAGFAEANVEKTFFSDEAGKRIDWLSTMPDIYVPNTSTFVPRTSGPSSITYSSSYTTSNFAVHEEAISNFNALGGVVGVHWVAYQTDKRTKKILVPSTDTKVLKVNAIKNLFGLFVFGYPPTPPPPTIVTVVDKISFVRAQRGTIADINTYEAATAADGFDRLPALSDRPELKKVINVHLAGATYTSDNCYASAYVLLGKGDNNPWNRPVIISDGWDPRNVIGIQEILEPVDPTKSLAPYGSTFIQSLLDKGNDVVFVDYGYGDDDIGSNARVLLKVIETVCSHATGDVVVAGYSMGGLIARTALLLGEKNVPASIQKVKKYISIDAPHLGAQVNLDMQSKLLDIASKPMGSISNFGTFALIAGAAYNLKGTAARQMLFTYPNNNGLHDQFYAFLKTLGNYPSSRIKKYAIADACWKWPYPGAKLSGEKAAVMNGTDLYVKNEDLFPGSYMDLWAADQGKQTVIPVGLFTGPLMPWTATYADYAGLATNAPINPQYGETRYLPTHMPLFSALGIEKDAFLTITEPKTQAELDVICKNNTSFDKLYLVDFTSRPRHIEFNTALTEKTLALIKKPDMSAILQLLLSD